MKSHQPLSRDGFSLVELVFALLLAGLAIWMAFLALRVETRLSSKVQTRSDLAQEARTILQWVREDLKLCCQPLSGGRFRPSLMDSLERGSGAGRDWFSFLSFSRNLPLDEAAPVRRFGKSVRQASRITWSLVARPGIPADEGMALERSVLDLASGPSSIIHPGLARRLSERVLAFSIRPQVVGENAGQIQVFRVMLRLRAGDPLTSPPFEIFEVVCPDFFQSIWGQHGIRHPWHTVISGP